MMRRLALLLVAALPTLAAAQADVAPRAPAAWIAYAETVNSHVTARLSSADDNALAVRTMLDTTRTDPTAPSAPLELRLWITSRGTIERVTLAELDGNATAALDALLVGQSLAGRPPRGMSMPLRLAIQLQPETAKRSPMTAGWSG